ncbi:MAG: hypothetical protein PR2021_2510 [Candidatus Phytoplasma pruni]|uniref:hypothetical protein n=1 Tax=Poinsettia branch-inducing phytoplasma TaxID=138647 RepID=UPI000377E69D|nr:hypothetical protein [Poinsettia branch-inducing phytoplasma]WEK82323.1 MAG: hypothetical protein PR2021_2510 [Candidatus Phytoplasma pruni]
MYPSIYFVANTSSLTANLKYFSQVIANFFDEKVTFNRYEDLFQYLVKKNQLSPVVVIIDEFSYLM